MRSDELTDALRAAADGQPPVPDRFTEILQGARRRRRLRLAAVFAPAVGLLATSVVLLLPDREDLTTLPPVSPPAADIETGVPCPGSVVRRIDGGDPTADALPPLNDSTTDRSVAEAVLDAHRDEIQQRYPNATRTEVGVGFGAAWTGTSGGAYDVVSVEDFGILVELPEVTDCPDRTDLPARIEAVPLFFLVTTPTAPGPTTPTAQDPVPLLPPVPGYTARDNVEIREVAESLAHPPLEVAAIDRRLIIDDDGFTMAEIVMIVYPEDAPDQDYLGVVFPHEVAAPTLVAGVEMTHLPDIAFLVWNRGSSVVLFQRAQEQSDSWLRDLAAATVHAFAASDPSSTRPPINEAPCGLDPPPFRFDHLPDGIAPDVLGYAAWSRAMTPPGHEAAPELYDPIFVLLDPTNSDRRIEVFHGNSGRLGSEFREGVTVLGQNAWLSDVSDGAILIEFVVGEGDEACDFWALRNHGLSESELRAVADSLSFR